MEAIEIVEYEDVFPVRFNYPGEGSRRKRKWKWWKSVLRNDPCTYCNKKGGTIEHIDPISKGGSVKGIDNIVGACEACNCERDTCSILLFILQGNPGYMVRLYDKNGRVKREVKGKRHHIFAKASGYLQRKKSPYDVAEIYSLRYNRLERILRREDAIAV